MRKAFLIAIAILFMLAVGAPAGAAETADAGETRTQIPFNVPVVVDGTSLTIPSRSADSGFVGACDVQLQCYGVSVLAAESGGSAAVGQTVAYLSGVICIYDQYAPCGSSGNPGTGIVITRRDVRTPSISVTPPKVDLRLCTWRGDPRTSPRCVSTDVIADPGGPVTVGGQDLQLFLGLLPDSILVHTGR